MRLMRCMKDRVKDRDQEWSERAECMEKMEMYSEELRCGPGKEYSDKIKEIIELICDILEEENNMQISSKCLNVLRRIVTDKRLNYKPAYPLLLHALLSKLADSKLTIRQQAQLILQTLIDSLRKIDFSIFYSTINSILISNNTSTL